MRVNRMCFVSLQFFGLAIFVYLLAESTHRHAQAYRDFLPPSLCSAGKPHVATGACGRLGKARQTAGCWLYIAVARQFFHLIADYYA